MNRVIFNALAFIVCSCNTNNRTLEELYRMQIPNSSKVIYQFYYEGPMAFSSAWSGTTILDSTETFSESKIIEFPGIFGFNIESANQITAIELRHEENNLDSLLVPVETYQQTIQGVKIDVARYNRMGGNTISGCGLREYYFDSFKETRDSLYFYGIERKFGQIKTDTCGFKKGGIKLIQNTDGNINRFEIGELVTGLKDTYKPDKPFTIVHEQPIVCHAINYFYPKDTINNFEVSDVGIFKKVSNKTYE